VNEILSHFVRYPQLADTVEGVTRWRLLNEIVTRQVDETQRALAWLALKGYLRETSTVATGPIYSLNHDKLEEACGFLAAARVDGRGKL
jgi:hypothetical protein